MPRPLGATPLLKFFCQLLRGVNVNYHAKFGGPNLKNDWVMPILVYTHKCHAPKVPHPFWNFFANFCRGSMWTTMQNLEVLTWKLNELWQIALNPTCESVSQWVSQSVTNLGIELFSQLKIKTFSWTNKVCVVPIAFCLWIIQLQRLINCKLKNFCRGSMWTTMQNLEVLAWKMTELCPF